MKKFIYLIFIFIGCSLFSLFSSDLAIITSTIALMFLVWEFSKFPFRTKIQPREYTEEKTSNKIVEQDERIITHPNGQIIHAKRIRQWN